MGSFKSLHSPTIVDVPVTGSSALVSNKSLQPTSLPPLRSGKAAAELGRYVRFGFRADGPVSSLNFMVTASSGPEAVPDQCLLSPALLGR